MHFRLSHQTVYPLVDRFEKSPIYASLRGPGGYERITPEKNILCYLWFVGHETASYRDEADRFGITLSTLHKIISRVSQFLVSIASNIIRFPTSEEKEIIKQYYKEKKRFPGVTGKAKRSS
ncbi:uncharacterized protein [Venturia canescens]|uniref:uncharacterized protein n=1 Tax=Venturia canescens TaxID=32260 RepID=UPI001C9BE6B3|nr:uncharacterized protein LOC122415371 [Venturia canescens]